MMHVAPAAWRRRAMAAPMPRDEPVTRALWPVRSMVAGELVAGDLLFAMTVMLLGNCAAGIVPLEGDLSRALLWQRRCTSLVRAGPTSSVMRGRRGFRSGT